MGPAGAGSARVGALTSKKTGEVEGESDEVEVEVEVEVEIEDDELEEKEEISEMVKNMFADACVAMSQADGKVLMVESAGRLLRSRELRVIYIPPRADDRCFCGDLFRFQRQQVEGQMY